MLQFLCRTYPANAVQRDVEMADKEAEFCIEKKNMKLEPTNKVMWPCETSVLDGALKLYTTMKLSVPCPKRA